MTNPLHAAHYADAALQRLATITDNVQIARDTWRVRLHCPEIAERITPGQFVMLRSPHRCDPLLARPLALYDVILDENGKQTAIDLVYLVIGKFTRHLTQLSAGHDLEIWGPLGNGFDVFSCRHLILVAGGIGQTPFLALAKEHLGQGRFGCPPRQVQPIPQLSFCYGAQSADLLAGVDDFEKLGIRVELATDDGSRGHHGLVTDRLAELLEEDPEGVEIACCGPEPMMQAVAVLAQRFDRPCYVSLETPMACGVGICFSCVTRIRTNPDQPWDYRRTCVDGPVFDAETVVW